MLETEFSIIFTHSKKKSLSEIQWEKIMDHWSLFRHRTISGY